MIDNNKLSDEPATIAGFIIDSFIGFIKEYPYKYILDENGNSHKLESEKPSNVSYSGLYDAITDSFKGIWRIENTKYWGEWTMKRGSA